MKKRCWQDKAEVLLKTLVELSLLLLVSGDIRHSVAWGHITLISVCLPITFSDICVRSPTSLLEGC